MSTPFTIESLGATLQGIARNVEEMRDEQREMREEIKLLRTIEIKHDHVEAEVERAFRQLDEMRADIRRIDSEIPERLGDRLLVMESHQPTHKLASSVVIKALIGAGALLAAFIWGSVTERAAVVPHSTQQPHSTSPATTSQNR